MFGSPLRDLKFCSGSVPGEIIFKLWQKNSRSALAIPVVALPQASIGEQEFLVGRISATPTAQTQIRRPPDFQSSNTLNSKKCRSEVRPEDGAVLVEAAEVVAAAVSDSATLAPRPRSSSSAPSCTPARVKWSASPPTQRSLTSTPRSSSRTRRPSARWTRSSVPSTRYTLPSSPATASRPPASSPATSSSSAARSSSPSRSSCPSPSPRRELPRSRSLGAVVLVDAAAAVVPVVSPEAVAVVADSVAAVAAAVSLEAEAVVAAVSVAVAAAAVVVASAAAVASAGEAQVVAEDVVASAEVVGDRFSNLVI